MNSLNALNDTVRWKLFARLFYFSYAYYRWGTNHPGSHSSWKCWTLDMNLGSFLFTAITLTTSESVYLTTYPTVLFRVSPFERRALYKYRALDSQPQWANLEEERKELSHSALILSVRYPKELKDIPYKALSRSDWFALILNQSKENMGYFWYGS